MMLENFLALVRRGDTPAFNDTQRIIVEHYSYRPTAFQNGPVANAAGQNEGSCRLFAFARLHGLTAAQTLALFGEHYREVLNDPQGAGHANIRAFIEHGWPGVVFQGEPLTSRPGSAE